MPDTDNHERKFDQLADLLPKDDSKAGQTTLVIEKQDTFNTIFPDKLSNFFQEKSPHFPKTFKLSSRENFKLFPGKKIENCSNNPKELGKFLSYFLLVVFTRVFAASFRKDKK